MSGLLGLVRIEARRNIGLWTFIPLILIACWIARSILPGRIWLWPDTSHAIRVTLFILGPLAAGIAAWMAGRDRRRRIGDLLATMPYPVPARNLAVWSGTAIWIAGAYITTGAVLLGLTAWNATGGSPVPFLSIVVVGILGVVAHTAFGYLAGHYLPSRFVAPLIATLLFVAQAAPGYSSSALIRYLSPVIAYLDADVFYGIRQDVSLPQAVWLLGLAGTALALVALRGQRTWPVWSTLAVSVAVTGVGAGMLLTTQEHRSADRAVIPYQPVCQDGMITVCVHPAYRKMLPETADIINRLAQPLSGIPGVPTRAEQRAFLDSMPGKANLPEGTIAFELENPTRFEWGYQTLSRDIVRGLVVDPSSPVMVSYYVRLEQIMEGGSNGSSVQEISPPSPMNPAQEVIADWLLERVWDDLCQEVSPDVYQCFGWGHTLNPETKAVRDRLNALDPAARHAWFAEHYAALRAGDLTLADLP